MSLQHPVLSSLLDTNSNPEELTVVINAWVVEIDPLDLVFLPFEAPSWKFSLVF